MPASAEQRAAFIAQSTGWPILTTTPISLPGPLANWKIDPNQLIAVGVVGIGAYTFWQVIRAVLS